MAKRRDVKSIVKGLRESQAELERNREEAVTLAAEVIRTAYSTLDPDYIENVNGLVGAMHRAATLEPESRGNALRRNVGGMRSYLEKAIEKREGKENDRTSQDQVETPKKSVITLSEAASYWREQDEAAGLPMPSRSGYQQRIYSAIKHGKLTPTPVSTRVRTVPLEQMDRLIKTSYEKPERSGPSEQPADKKARRTIPGVAYGSRPYDAYTSLRNQGLSPKEVRERHAFLCPPGKNPGKFFGSLEGSYQRYRVSRKKR
jgi:hypothetical protein